MRALSTIVRKKRTYYAGEARLALRCARLYKKPWPRVARAYHDAWFYFRELSRLSYFKPDDAAYACYLRLANKSWRTAKRLHAHASGATAERRRANLSPREKEDYDMGFRRNLGKIKRR